MIFMSVKLAKLQSWNFKTETVFTIPRAAKTEDQDRVFRSRPRPLTRDLMIMLLLREICAYVCVFHLFLSCAIFDQELIPHRYSSFFFLLGWRSSKIPKSPSFQIESRWNLMFFEEMRIDRRSRIFDMMSHFHDVGMAMTSAHRSLMRPPAAR